MALTGGGGMHLYFRAPANQPVGNSAGRLGPGIDVRGSGGYVVAPPSRHPSGRAYAWDAGFHPDDTSLAPLPQPLAQMLMASVQSRKVEAVTPAPHIPKGRRNATLASLAGFMRRRGMNGEAILAALTVTNRERCRPSLPQAEVERIARSVARYPAREDGGSSLEAALAALPRTDAGNAEAFVALHHDRFRYDHRRHIWLIWDGARWREDADGEAGRAMIETVRRRRAALAAQIKEPAEARPAVARAFGQEARCTGQLREARREDLLTHQAGTTFDPNAACPHWLQFLERLTLGQGNTKSNPEPEDCTLTITIEPWVRVYELSIVIS